MRNGWQGLSSRRCVTTMAMFGWWVGGCEATAKPMSAIVATWVAIRVYQLFATENITFKTLSPTISNLCQEIISWTIDFLPQHFLLCFSFSMLWKKNYLLYGQTGVSMSCSRTIKFSEIYCRNFYYCCVRRNKVFMVKSIQLLYPVLHESDINPFNLHKTS